MTAIFFTKHTEHANAQYIKHSKLMSSIVLKFPVFYHLDFHPTDRHSEPCFGIVLLPSNFKFPWEMLLFCQFINNKA